MTDELNKILETPQKENNKPFITRLRAWDVYWSCIEALANIASGTAELDDPSEVEKEMLNAIYQVRQVVNV